MEHIPIPEPVGFADISKSDQDVAGEALWDGMAEQPANVPVLEADLELAEERLAEFQRDRTQARSAFDILDHLGRRQQGSDEHDD